MLGLRGNQNLFRPRAEFFYLSSRSENMAVRLSAFARQPGGKNFRTLRFNHTEDDAHAVTCNISDHAGRHERRPALSYLDVNSGPFPIWLSCLDEAAEPTQLSDLGNNHPRRICYSHRTRCFEGNADTPISLRAFRKIFSLARVSSHSVHRFESRSIWVRY